MKPCPKHGKAVQKYEKKPRLPIRIILVSLVFGIDTKHNNMIMNKKTMIAAASLLIALTAFAQQSNVNLSYNPAVKRKPQL